MNLNSQPIYIQHSRTYAVDEFAKCSAEIFDWRPGERVRFIAPMRWPTSFLVRRASIIAILCGILGAVVFLNYPVMAFLIFTVTSGCLSFWWMGRPERTVTLDWKKQTLRIKTVLSVNSSDLVSYVRSPGTVSFSAIQAVRIESILNPKSEPTEPDTFDAILQIDVKDRGSIDIVGPRTSREEGETAMCQALAPAARWFAAVLDIPYVVPNCLWGQTEKEAKGLRNVAPGANPTERLAFTPNEDALPLGHVAGTKTDGDEHSKAFDEFELAACGIVHWEPGQRCKFRQQGSLLSDLFSEGAATFLVVMIGGACLLSLLNRYVVTLSFNDTEIGIGLMIVGILACTLSVFYGYKPTRISILDWAQRRVTSKAGRDELVASFDEIVELQLSGRYTPERTVEVGKSQTSRTYPAQWTTWLSLSLKNGQTLQVANGSEMTADDEKAGPAQRSYEELLPFAHVLAESIGVRWSWRGFEGHEAFRPHVVKFDAPKKVAADRELERAMITIARAKFSQLIDGNSDDQLRKAIAHLRLASELDPNSLEPYLEAAKICEHRNDFRTAIEFYTAVLKIDPKHIDSYRSRGRHFAHIGESFRHGALDPEPNDFLKNATEDFTKAIALDESHRDFESRGRAYFAAGQHEEAVADFPNALQFNQHTHFSVPRVKHFEISITLGYRAEALCKLKKWKQALKDVEEAIEIHPKSIAWNGKLRSDIREALGG